MNYTHYLKALKNDLCTDWKPFELAWLAAFLVAQAWAFWVEPKSWLEMIAGVSGIICVVLVSKGKISNYLFGLIFAYSYFYASWQANFLGEMNTVLYVYLPSQFIGYFLWKENLQKAQSQTQSHQAVTAKTLSRQGWLILVVGVAMSSLIFIQILKAYGGSSVALDGVTTMLVVAAQLLMILRYREQWIAWIAVNILSMYLWANSTAMYLMYGAYLLNSVYGFYNWTKLQKSV